MEGKGWCHCPPWLCLTLVKATGFLTFRLSPGARQVGESKSALWWPFLEPHLTDKLSLWQSQGPGVLGLAPSSVQIWVPPLRLSYWVLMWKPPRHGIHQLLLSDT